MLIQIRGEDRVQDRLLLHIGFDRLTILPFSGPGSSFEKGHHMSGMGRSDPARARIALYTGRATDYLHYYPFIALLEALGLDYFPVNDHFFLENGLVDFHILIVPGGTPPLSELGRCFGGERGFRNIRRFVYEGGSYIGTGLGALLATRYRFRGRLLFFGLTRAENMLGLSSYHVGSGFVDLKLKSSAGKGGVFEELRRVLYWNGPAFRLKSCDIASPYSGESGECGLWSSRALSLDAYQSWLKEKGAIVFSRFGQGRVILSGPQPEFGDHFLSHQIAVSGNLPVEPARLERNWDLITSWITWAAGGREVKQKPNYVRSRVLPTLIQRVRSFLDCLEYDALRLKSQDVTFNSEKHRILENLSIISGALDFLSLYEIDCRRAAVLNQILHPNNFLSLLQYAYSVPEAGSHDRLRLKVSFFKGIELAKQPEERNQFLARLCVALETLSLPLSRIMERFKSREEAIFAA
jgi:hypothetical protein